MLLCFSNIDWLSIYFNNIDNFLVMKNIHIPVIHRFDDPFLLKKRSFNSFITQSFVYTPYYLTEIKLRQLYIYFEHFSTIKLCLLLEQLKHKVNKLEFDLLIKYCFFFLKYCKSLGCFKFTL